tara:strand:- start:65247 stop:67004 length:1758 start_codon:yes stop_codon:yes gene_type:complete
MADKSFFGRLQTLFSTSTIVRRTGDGGIKVVDVNKVQQGSNLASNRLVDRFNRLYQSHANTGNRAQANYHAARLQLFTDYEVMDEDSIISSALDIYADESTLKNEFGSTLDIQSSNSEVQKILHNLFYDVLNIEFNLWPWVRNMCKYGDMYLKMDITEKLGVTNVSPFSPYEMIRVDGEDPQNPEIVTFIHDPAMSGQPTYGAGGANRDQDEFQNYEIAHFRLLSDSNFLPYGKSMIEAARKNWKQLTLMEDAMMIHRIMRAPEKRVFKIDIGNIPPAEVDNYMKRVIDSMKKTPYIDQATGQYNLEFNLQNMMEDFYLPVRGGQSGTEIDSLSGMEFTGIDDIEYLRNRMFAALKVPKAFLGYDENLGEKATLAAEDVRFARTIERIQKIVISELTKIAIVHLYSQGYNDADLVDFELNLTNPSTIYEQEKIELWSNKVSLADSLKENKMLSENWIYDKIFGLSDDEIKKEKANVIEDSKNNFRKETIETDGEDPANPPSDEPIDNDDSDDGSETSFEEYGEMGGQDKKAPAYGKSQDSARGRDPLGKETRSIHRENFIKSLALLGRTKTSLLSENNILDDNAL